MFLLTWSCALSPVAAPPGYRSLASTLATRVQCPRVTLRPSPCAHVPSSGVCRSARQPCGLSAPYSYHPALSSWSAARQCGLHTPHSFTVWDCTYWSLVEMPSPCSLANRSALLLCFCLAATLPCQAFADEYTTILHLSSLCWTHPPGCLSTLVYCTPLTTRCYLVPWA